MENRRVLVEFPFSYPGRMKYLVHNFLPEGNDFSRILHLTSHAPGIEDFRMQLWRALNKPVILPESYTLKGFAAKIVGQHSSRRLIGNIERYLILYRLCAPLAQVTGSSQVSIASQITGFVRDFKTSHSTLDFQLYRSKVSSYRWNYQQNQAAIEGALDILEKYQAYLNENSLCDEDDVYIYAGDCLDRTSYDMLVLDGLFEFLPSQRIFIEKLAARCKSLVATYCRDSGASADVKGLILDKAFDFLGSLADEKIQVAGALRKPEIFVRSAPSPEEEVRCAGQQILAEIRENPSLAWEDFLVVFPEMPSYRTVVKRIFGRMGIPYRMTPGYTLVRDPSIVSVLSIFDLLEAQSWENLMNVFSSPFFDFNPKETARFSLETREEFAGVGFFPEKKWLGRWKNYQKLNKALAGLKKNTGTLSDWSTALLNLIEALGWHGCEAESSSMFYEICENLRGEDVVDRQTFRRILEYALESAEVEKSKGEFGVRIMGVLDSAGIETEIVFFGGATDAALPTAASRHEFFLPDALKKELGLNHYRLQIARERLDIYRLKCGNRKIFFTYPTKVNGIEQSKSLMLFDLDEFPFDTPPVFSLTGTGRLWRLQDDWEKFMERFYDNGVFSFSATQLDKLATCPFRFYLEEVEGVFPYEVPSIEEDPALWGLIVHRAAQDAAVRFKGMIIDAQSAAGQKQLFEERLEFYLNNPESIDPHRATGFSPVVKEFLKPRVPIICRMFNTLTDQHIGHKIVDVEHKCTETIGKIVLTGKFDRIEENKDLVEVIDFKTGRDFPVVEKNAPDRNKFLDASGNPLPACQRFSNTQFILYYLLAKKHFSKDSLVIAWKLHFQEPDEIEKRYPHISGIADEFEKSIEELAERFLTRNFRFLPSRDNSCYYCDFRDFCPAKNE